MSKRRTTKTVKETAEVQTMAAEMPEEALPAAASEAEVQTAPEETPIALAAEATAETSSALRGWSSCLAARCWWRHCGRRKALSICRT